MGSRTFAKVQHFTRFIINVESTNNPENISPQNVGSFQLYGDNLSQFKEDCVNTIHEVNSLPKTEVFFMWSAPPPGSGCVTFRQILAMCCFTYLLNKSLLGLWFLKTPIAGIQMMEV